MEVSVSSETFINICHSTLRHIPKYSNLNNSDNWLETAKNAFPSPMIVYHLNRLFVTGVSQAA
jgi:hypothetical protein